MSTSHSHSLDFDGTLYLLKDKISTSDFCVDALVINYNASHLCHQ